MWIERGRKGHYWPGMQPPVKDPKELTCLSNTHTHSSGSEQFLLTMWSLISSHHTQLWCEAPTLPFLCAPFSKAPHSALHPSSALVQTHFPLSLFPKLKPVSGKTQINHAGVRLIMQMRHRECEKEQFLSVLRFCISNHNHMEVQSVQTLSASCVIVGEFWPKHLQHCFTSLRFSAIY